MASNVTFDNGGTRQIRRYRFTDGGRLSSEAQAKIVDRIGGLGSVFRVTAGGSGTQVEIYPNESWNHVAPLVEGLLSSLRS